MVDTIEICVLVVVVCTLLFILLWVALGDRQSGRRLRQDMGESLPGKPRSEFSKRACAVMSIILVVVGIWMIWRYFQLVELAIRQDSGALPDAALPIAGITAIVAPFVSYLLYQAGLKNSRNKYGVDADGQPFRKTLDGADAPDEPTETSVGER